MSPAKPHITVCICTFQRPAMLRRLLNDICTQQTDGLFTHSIVVADNDEARSAEPVVNEVRSSHRVPIQYCVEPTRGISPTRNRAIAHTEGDYVALIDDDEFPIRTWLLTLLRTCHQYGVDGVLGPVRRHFDQQPPRWLEKSRFYDRSVTPTGTVVVWNEARTGNVLLKRDMLIGDPAPFRPEFKIGEDQDFFRRKMEQGRRFVWSAEAEAFEVIPPARWNRIYLIRKALLRGACAALQPSCGPANIAKSILAVVLYALALPFSLFLGQHRFMTLLVKLCDHLGKLFAKIGFHPIKGAYIADGPA